MFEMAFDYWLQMAFDILIPKPSILMMFCSQHLPNSNASHSKLKLQTEKRNQIPIPLNHKLTPKPNPNIQFVQTSQ